MSFFQKAAAAARTDARRVVSDQQAEVHETQNLTPQTQTNALRNQEPDLHTLLGPVDDSAYDPSGSVCRGCLEGNNIMERIALAFKQDATRIFWLYGPAGSGKSTIAWAIAERYAASKRLAASFFFRRGQVGNSGPSAIVPTLAYQLTLSVPSTKPLIQAVLRSEPSILTHPLRDQFNKLLVEPLLQAKGTVLTFLTRPMSIVIDTLDEFDDKYLTAEFVSTLLDAFRSNPRLHLRIIIVSRIEKEVQNVLKTSTAKSITESGGLLPTDPKIMCEFYRSRLSAIYEQKGWLMGNVSQSWPSESDLNALVGKCRLFGLADAILKYIDDGDGPPDQKLKSVLAVDGLFPFFAQVFSDAPRNENFGRVVGTIMVQNHSAPLSIISLAYLLRLETTDILQALQGVRVLFRIPGRDEDSILPLKSLQEFLSLDPLSQEFFIDFPTRHCFMVKDCLAVIREDSNSAVEKSQPYASLTWCFHLYFGLKDGTTSFELTSVMDSIKNFAFGKNGLYLEAWVDVVILRDGIERVLNQLAKVKELPHFPPNLKKTFEIIENYAKLNVSEHIVPQLSVRLNVNICWH